MRSATSCALRLRFLTEGMIDVFIISFLAIFFLGIFVRLPAKSRTTSGSESESMKYPLNSLPFFVVMLAVS